MTTDQRTGWIADLKVGDAVIRDGGQSWQRRPVLTLCTVTRITPSGRISVAFGHGVTSTYNPDGRERGGGGTLLPATEENRAILAETRDRERLRLALRGYAPSSSPIAHVRAILAVLEDPGILDRLRAGLAEARRVAEDLHRSRELDADAFPLDLCSPDPLPRKVTDAD